MTRINSGNMPGEANIHLPATPGILQTLEARRSCIVSLDNVDQYSLLKSDILQLRSQGTEGLQTTPSHLGVLMLNGEGLIYGNARHGKAERRIGSIIDGFAPEVSPDSEAAEEVVNRLIVISGLYGQLTRRQGAGTPSLIQKLTQKLKQPGQPMILAVTKHLWEIPSFDRGYDWGAPENFLTAIAVGITLNQSGELVDYHRSARETELPLGLKRGFPAKPRKFTSTNTDKPSKVVIETPTDQTRLGL